ncbi:ABC transporter substrate-binding protein [Defluviitalea raffinosedens]|uniref:ABC transporter substrate-binding protein n=1 Tax=Defluviitalea raffinosedens TaxID=1450156 RepID=UPI00195BFDE8|nr:ABC transporter substrate-binding protein [Defluviitalea raffinosedens]MBM7685840.1 spermidine/putrescine transport system substrate-binding protein [Defluviitalea raffinosedens]
MKKWNLAAFLLILLTVLGISGCGQQNKVVLNVYNWGDYIDESVIEDFEKQYNIKVNYETFATNEDMYVKIKSGGTDYDVIFPSEYMIEKMINENLLQKLDFSNIPNYALIDDQFKNLDYDPNNEYSVPYMWGTVGILYNKTMVDDPVDSWDILWNEKYAGQIFMLDSQRESIGVALQKLGYSLNTRDVNELQQAKQALIEQKPLVLAYVGDEVKDKMIGGEAALAVVWSGDAIYCKRENPDLEYVIPKEGSNYWFDAMAIPVTSKHKKEAEMFINYLCETEVALKNTDYIGYSTPHAKAKEMLSEELKNDRAAYPLPEDIARCEVYKDLGDFVTEFDKVWTEIMAQ